MELGSNEWSPKDTVCKDGAHQTFHLEPSSKFTAVQYLT